MHSHEEESNIFRKIGIYYISLSHKSMSHACTEPTCKVHMLCEKLYSALKRSQYIFSISNTTKLLILFQITDKSRRGFFAG